MIKTNEILVLRLQEADDYKWEMDVSGILFRQIILCVAFGCTLDQVGYRIRRHSCYLRLDSADYEMDSDARKSL